MRGDEEGASVVVGGEEGGALVVVVEEEVGASVVVDGEEGGASESVVVAEEEVGASVAVGGEEGGASVVEGGGGACWGLQRFSRHIGRSDGQALHDIPDSYGGLPLTFPLKYKINMKIIIVGAIHTK